MGIVLFVSSGEFFVLSKLRWLHEIAVPLRNPSPLVLYLQENTEDEVSQFIGLLLLYTVRYPPLTKLMVESGLWLDEYPDHAAIFTYLHIYLCSVS